MTDAPFVEASRIQTILKDFGELRRGIRSHDTFATEAAWEKCERWLEYLPTTPQRTDT